MILPCSGGCLCGARMLACSCCIQKLGRESGGAEATAAAEAGSSSLELLLLEEWDRRHSMSNRLRRWPKSARTHTHMHVRSATQTGMQTDHTHAHTRDRAVHRHRQTHATGLRRRHRHTYFSHTACPRTRFLRLWVGGRYCGWR